MFMQLQFFDGPLITFTSYSDRESSCESLKGHKMSKDCICSNQMLTKSHVVQACPYRDGPCTFNFCNDNIPFFFSFGVF